MTVEYGIKAIPTVYGARQFRSRLEAKWASFFSLCGWQFEYEPFDLGTWSPDFLLLGKTKVLVEVKPITAIDKDVTAKMISAARSANWDGDLLLVGVAPLFDMGDGPYDSPALGWLGEHCLQVPGNNEWYFSSEEGPANAEHFWMFGRASVCDSGDGSPDFTHDEWSYGGRMFGFHFKDNKWPNNSDWLKRLWDRSANKVQWQKR